MSNFTLADAKEIVADLGANDDQILVSDDEIETMTADAAKLNDPAKYFRGWIRDIMHESNCDGAAAARFEEMAYGDTRDDYDY